MNRSPVASDTESDIPSEKDVATVTSPLSGLRILDLTNVVMGPYATQILADYGADVIKVESPAGDSTRLIPPMRHKGMGGLFIHLNRNKRSVVLDLKDPDGIEAFRKIAETVDVVITNVRAAGLERLGIGYESLLETSPKLIWLSLVGYGSNGPYGGRPAYDDLIQGLTALPSMLVQAGSENLHYVPLSYNDRAVGLHACIALLAAIQYREATGKGQFIEVPMYEIMAQFTLADHICGHTFEPPIGPPGYKRSLTKERHPYATKDGFICVLVYNDKHWRAFWDMVGQPDRFDSDPRLQNMSARTDHAPELLAELSELLKERTTAEWLDSFSQADIPAMPLHTLESAIYDPHLEEVGLFQVTEHPTEGAIREISVPVRWSEAPLPGLVPAPSLGQHTAEVLREVGVDEAVTSRLTAKPGSNS